MTINFNDVKLTLYNWSVAVLPVGMPVIFYEPNAPRPLVPYVSLFLSSIVSVHEDWSRETTDTSGNVDMQGNRQFTLQIQAYGGDDPLTILENMKTSLQKQSILDILRVNGIVYFSTLNIIDISELMDTQWEKRATLDVLLGIGQTYKDGVGYFDHLNIEEEIKNVKGEIISNETFAIPEN